MTVDLLHPHLRKQGEGEKEEVHGFHLYLITLNLVTRLYLSAWETEM